MSNAGLPRSNHIRNSLLFLWLAVAFLVALPAWAVDVPRTSPIPVTNPPEENPLPKGMTPEEEGLRHLIGAFSRQTAPPPGPGIRQCAEWEPVTGALVRYPFGLPNGLMREYATEIELWVLVGSSSQQNTAFNILNNAGVNMANVRFLICPTNSIWTRDYGPQFIFDANGQMGIVDHIYNRPRPLDDQVNYALGVEWDIPVYGSPLVHTGGNYMCNGHGAGYSTDLVYDENSFPNHQVDAYMYSYQGIDPYYVVPDISPYGIHHIDCWAKLLDEETILVKEVWPGHPDYNALEQNVATMQTWTNAYGRPYNVIRVYCGSIGGSQVAAYTNSVILNNKVFVPTFNISTDAAALQVYRDAMPGYEVYGFTGSWYSDDAIHCRTMGIHDKRMLYVDHAPMPDSVTVDAGFLVDALIDARSGMGLKSDSLLVYWRTGGDPEFSAVQMTASAGVDSFYAYIPHQPVGTTVEYYVFAADNSGRRSARPYPAPEGFYSFVVAGDPASVDGPGSDRTPALSDVWPNPFQESISFNFALPSAGETRLDVVDVQGRRVANLVDGRLSAGGHSAHWNGLTLSGERAAAGIYFLHLQARGQESVRRVVKIQ